MLERGERGWQGSVNESMRKREQQSEKKYWSPDVYYNQLNHVSFMCHLVIERGKGTKTGFRGHVHTLIHFQRNIFWFTSYSVQYIAKAKAKERLAGGPLKEVGVPHEHAICMCTHCQVRWIGIRKHRRRGCVCSKTKQRHGGCLAHGGPFQAVGVVSALAPVANAPLWPERGWHCHCTSVGDERKRKKKWGVLTCCCVTTGPLQVR